MKRIRVLWHTFWKEYHAIAIEDLVHDGNTKSATNHYLKFLEHHENLNKL